MAFTTIPGVKVATAGARCRSSIWSCCHARWEDRSSIATRVCYQIPVPFSTVKRFTDRDSGQMPDRTFYAADDSANLFICLLGLEGSSRPLAWRDEELHV